MSLLLAASGAVAWARSTPYPGNNVESLSLEVFSTEGDVLVESARERRAGERPQFADGGPEDQPFGTYSQTFTDRSTAEAWLDLSPPNDRDSSRLRLWLDEIDFERTTLVLAQKMGDLSKLTPRTLYRTDDGIQVVVETTPPFGPEPLGPYSLLIALVDDSDDPEPPSIAGVDFQDGRDGPIEAGIEMLDRWLSG
ncbi:hypothetical protein [Halococcoides cellulosivorans]|uniref:hypothetical protein n=1 Tax=Halococcoides cellulosivorans TaxID=1679096 RepID=UPI00131F390D|nr:hypothetical protein [Halococcoides cellulosivorans]